MKILYAGDSPLGGAANYLLGVLKWVKADAVHVSPSECLTPKILSQKFDAVIFSDYSSEKVSAEIQKKILSQIENGMGFLMIGGWGSFSGPFGKWRGTFIEKILPVECLNRDDRTNFPGGASVTLKNNHPMFRSFSFKNPPVVCGLNKVTPKKTGTVLLTTRKILIENKKAKLDSQEHPLLVIDSHPNKRIAAFTTDAAPHWCGGLVDWGDKRVKIRLNSTIQIEVGNQYIQFLSALIRWLVGGKKNDQR